MTRGAATWCLNDRDLAFHPAPPDAAARDFHLELADYRPTELIELPELAAELGAGRVVAKAESNRLGLPAFKALGASWAMNRALSMLQSDERVTFVTASDGNHGRAVARFAAVFGHNALVVIPRGVHPVAVDAIIAEGAEVRVIDADYDGAVRLAAQVSAGLADAGVLLQDTAWDGYTDVPNAIVDGYTTLFSELDAQLATNATTNTNTNTARASIADDRSAGADLVIVPTGVGSLLHAALRHYRSRQRDVVSDVDAQLCAPTDGTQGNPPSPPAIVSVEPATAACVYASLQNGTPTTVTTGETVMAGLNCGTVSTLAWPDIAAGLDAAVVVDDAAAHAAVADLAECGVDVGPCGGASLAALRAIAASDDLVDHLHLDDSSTVVLLHTEGSDANPSIVG